MSYFLVDTCAPTWCDTVSCPSSAICSPGICLASIILQSMLWLSIAGVCIYKLKIFYKLSKVFNVQKWLFFVGLLMALTRLVRVVQIITGVQVSSLGNVMADNLLTWTGIAIVYQGQAALCVFWARMMQNTMGIDASWRRRMLCVTVPLNMLIFGSAILGATISSMAMWSTDSEVVNTAGPAITAIFLLSSILMSAMVFWWGSRLTKVLEKSPAAGNDMRSAAISRLTKLVRRVGLVSLVCSFLTLVIGGSAAQTYAQSTCMTVRVAFSLLEAASLGSLLYPLRKAATPSGRGAKPAVPINRGGEISSTRTARVKRPSAPTIDLDEDDIAKIEADAAASAEAGGKTAQSYSNADADAAITRIASATNLPNSAQTP